MVRIRATDVVLHRRGRAHRRARRGDRRRRAGRASRRGCRAWIGCARLALVACDGALVDAALSPAAPEWNGERTAIVLGTAYGCHATNEDYYRGLVREGAARRQPAPVRLYAAVVARRGNVDPLRRARADARARPTVWPAASTRSPRASRSSPKGAPIARSSARPTWPRRCLLRRSLRGGAAAPLVDAAAALVVERTADASARGASPRGRLLARRRRRSPPARARGRAADACRRALADADVDRRRAIRRTLDGSDEPGALGAASLVALARWLAAGERDALALVLGGDDGGAGGAAVVVAS